MTNEGDYNYDGYYDGNVVGNAWHRNDTNVHLYAYANHTLEEADLLKDQGINLYSIGLFKTMANMPQEGKNIAEFFKMTASDIATSEDYFIRCIRWMIWNLRLERSQMIFCLR